MRAFLVLFAAVSAEMTLDAEEVEGLLSAEELDEMYDELDANKDGKLLESEVWNSLLEEIGDESADAPELSEKLKQMLKDSDANKDGTISKPELSSFVQGAQSILEEMDMDEMDENDEEELDEEEPEYEA